MALQGDAPESGMVKRIPAKETMQSTGEGLTPMAHAAQNKCFGCGPANPAGLRLEFQLAEDGSVVCLTTVPNTFDGHPGYLHGGVIATLLDEAMSKAVRASGSTSMTGRMEIDYLRPVPSGARLRLEGRIVRSEGRKHWTEAKLLNSTGIVLAQSKGLFIAMRVR
jgi:uncharacterized protein (TIGR00369 family)